MLPFFQCLSLNLTDIATSIKNAVKHLSTSLNGVESRTRDRICVLAQGRVIDRHGMEMRMHQQILSHIAHARTRLRSVEARAQAVQWKQPHVMREMCSMNGLRNLTSHICTRFSSHPVPPIH
ncbi:hypothetical protein EWM64_g10419 [Hericium alpestre]|uniref:Uncharacterized protein n=1 Tax=Hericium alpestre TaxID=135208 RepID=A0A4Y9ZIC4_9AGAM|nr:hypothetical protein EWM64_g10419 [Hericium alpestre]